MSWIYIWINKKHSFIFRSVVFKLGSRTEVHLWATFLPRILQQHWGISLVFRTRITITKNILGGWNNWAGSCKCKSLFYERKYFIWSSIKCFRAALNGWSIKLSSGVLENESHSKLSDVRLFGQFLDWGTCWIMEPSFSRHFRPWTWSQPSTARNTIVSSK